jgi:hypothetical protein
VQALARRLTFAGALGDDTTARGRPEALGAGASLGI